MIENSSDNIWSFASKFKYYIATSGTYAESYSDEPLADSTVQQTFPTIGTPEVEQVMQTDVKQKTKAKDGSPEPPKPLSR